MANNYEIIIENIIRWGKSSEEVLGIITLGSRSRKDHEADEYSDLDMAIIVQDPPYYLATDEWLSVIGKYHISFDEPSFDGCKSRRILFDGALDVDFIFMPESVAASGFSGEAAMILKRGFKVLLDKIALQEAVSQVILAKDPYIMLSEKEFHNIVNDFWFHAMWTTKKLKRGELWTAKNCLDMYMKGRLLTVIEIYAHSIHGSDYDTWYGGRFMEEWAEPWIMKNLEKCFSHYVGEDMKAALLQTMDLFRAISMEIAEKNNFSYPAKEDAYSTEWVNSMLCNGENL